MKINRFKLVGIIGKLNSGKDTIADLLEKKDYDRRAFADPVKLLVQEMFDIPDDVLWGPSGNRTGEVRQMLQQLGTDYARKFRPNIWVDKAAAFIELARKNSSKGVVVPDVRYLNEGVMLRDKNAILVRVVRPGSGSHETEKANAHSSETESAQIPDDWVDYTMVNDGSLSTLHINVKAFIERYQL